MSADSPAVRRATIADLQSARDANKKFAVVTAYDRATAEIAEAAGIGAILVGDSLAQVALGHESTVRIGMEEMLHHVAAVVRSTSAPLVIADMPFLSYADEAIAVSNAGRFIREAGAGAVKMEGGAEMASITAALARSGAPVIGHIGLTPQSALAEGRPRVKGRAPDAAEALIADALALEAAGAAAIVIELVPTELAAAITARVRIPTIGIGAGNGCSGQVQVMPDLLGLLAGRPPRHARPFANLREKAISAIEMWRADVEAGNFPGDAESIEGDDALRSALEAIIANDPARRDAPRA